MPTYRDEIVVLRTHKLGEADRIVTMLSRQHGKIRAVAKGVRRTSSKFGSRLEPFMVADEVAPLGAPRVSDATRELLAALLTGDWDAAEASPPAARAQATGIVAAYTQFHLERGLRSLPHVDRSEPSPRAATA